MKINAQTPPNMYGKKKPNLMERGLEIPRRKASSLMCFLCHSQILSTEVSQDNKRKYEG
jgi:hypothetical protein